MFLSVGSGSSPPVPRASPIRDTASQLSIRRWEGAQSHDGNNTCLGKEKKILFRGFATINFLSLEDDSLQCSGGQAARRLQDQGPEEGTCPSLRLFLARGPQAALGDHDWCAHCSNPSGFFLHTYEKELILPDRAFLI